MKYETPEVDFIIIDENNVFMTASGNGSNPCGSYTVSYASAADALVANCGGYNGGKPNQFSCNDFGGYGPSNPPTQNAQVTLSGGSTYIFDYKGNHWKEHKGN